ncbi:hypothetical protein Tco_0731964 [Tanacetum coccineum]
MSRFSCKKGSNMGYQKSGSFGSSSFKKDKGVENASNITMIKDVDLMLDNITDSQEGQCYSISNFAIAENSDVIGSVVAIGDVVPEQYVVRNIQRTVVIDDAEKGQILGWDTDYLLRSFGTKIFINRDVPEILAFRLRLHKENGWAYIACMECNRKVDVVESKASSSSSKNQVTIYCEEHGGSGCIQDVDEGLTTPASHIKSTNLNDPSVTRVLNMQTPSSGMEAFGSRQSSRSDKK